MQILKRSIVCLLLTLTPLTVFAEERNTLFSMHGMHHGGFGGPVLKATKIGDNTNYLMGGKGAWLINHQFYLGGGGQGTLKDINSEGERMAYGGLIFGYIGQPNKPVNYSLEMLIGGGRIGMSGLHDEVTSHNTQGDSSDGFFAAEPAVLVNFNLSRFATASVGLSYRYISGSNQATLTDSELSGLTAQLSFMFGRF